MKFCELPVPGMSGSPLYDARRSDVVAIANYSLNVLNEIAGLAIPATVIASCARLAAKADVTEHADLAILLDEVERVLSNPAQSERKQQLALRFKDFYEDALAGLPKSVENGAKKSSDLRGIDLAAGAPPIPVPSRVHVVHSRPNQSSTDFQGRESSTQQLIAFLKNPGQRVATVVGRSGFGKTALVSHLLHSLESGRLPNDEGEFALRGIIYLSEIGPNRISFASVSNALSELLDDKALTAFNAAQKDPLTSVQQRLSALLTEFRGTRPVAILLDNFEALLDPTNGLIRDAEIVDFFTCLLDQPQHSVKVFITTKEIPMNLLSHQPGGHAPVVRVEGLPAPHAENLLRRLDFHGLFGLHDAKMPFLTEVAEDLRRSPRALQAFVSVLSTDIDMTLAELAQDIKFRPPDAIASELIGESFSRLDKLSQTIMRTLAVFERPVSRLAVEYVLEPYVGKVDSRAALKRLVNMYLVRKEESQYYLHSIDRSLIVRVTSHHTADSAFDLVGARSRAAQYFEISRKPQKDWKTFSDIEPVLAEFDLRSDLEECGPALTLLKSISEPLRRWGYQVEAIKRYQRLEAKGLQPELELQRLFELGRVFLATKEYSEADKCFESSLDII